MIDEMRFASSRGSDLKMSLAAHDNAILPESSRWSYTRFFRQGAFADDFRRGAQQ
jgi:hypothetical protein